MKKSKDIGDPTKKDLSKKLDKKKEIGYSTLPQRNRGSVAQSVEHGTENPGVGSSILP